MRGNFWARTSLKRKRYTREVKWGACIQRKRRRGLDNERSLPSLLSPFRVLSELVPALFRPCIWTFQQKIPVWGWHRVVYLYKMMVFFIFYYSNENRQVKSDIKNVIYIRKKNQISTHSLATCQTLAPSFTNIITRYFFNTSFHPAFSNWAINKNCK